MSIEMLQKTVIFVLLAFQAVYSSEITSKWYYQCTENYCERTLISPNGNIFNPLSLAECNLLCLDYAGIWPRPTGQIIVKNLTEVNISNFFLAGPQTTKDILETAFELFTSKIRKLMPCRSFLKRKSSYLSPVYININVSDTSVVELALGTNESYTIETIATEGNAVNVSVKAENFFGARNALETLSQLVIYDDLRNRTLFPAEISIVDGPVYPWRGLMIDLVRNYVTPKTIKRTIEGMAASKLNTLHLHLTDTASFPYVSESHPELSGYGAYSLTKVYTNETIMDLVEHARVRGIRVVPELDAPAHVGEGWQNSGVLTCFNWQPWLNYCAEPPCGQVNPSKSELYDLLEDLYGDMLAQFGNNVFHMGGDEVNVNCWNNTETLTNWMVEEKGWGIEKNDFISNVWGYFQSEALKRLYKKAGKEIPVILWNSDLTNLDNVEDILPPSNYIIQIWVSSNSLLQNLLDKNYSLILSDYNSVYLDCGFAGWVSNGTNWCSPYKGWQTVYDYKPINVAGSKTSQILGGEVALWTEESGTSSLDSRLWPRSAAYAETLWAEPTTSWSEAQERMLIHRDRLVELGIDADEIQPEWCLQHQQNCPTNGKFVVNN